MKVNFFSKPNVVQCGTFIQAVNSRCFAYLVLTVYTILALCIKTTSNTVFMESIAKPSEVQQLLLWLILLDYTALKPAGKRYSTQDKQ
jgi:hypothetical protein